MKEARLAELIGEVREEYAEEAAPPAARRKPWRRGAALVACLALVLALGTAAAPFLGLMGAKSEAPAELGDVKEEAPAEMLAEGAEEEPESGDMMPHVVVDGVTYYISSHLSSYDACPEGFAYAGEIESGEFAGEKYYLNPDQPQVVYVYTLTNNDGRVDEHNTVIATEWHMAYVRFVSAEMRGKDFICVDGQLYISMWSAWGAVDGAFYDSVEMEYGVRIEGDAPEGFVSVGVTEFTGYDIWPTGTLSSNEGEYEVFVNPDEPDIILAAATWHSAKGVHSGFNVYIRYGE